MKCHFRLLSAITRLIVSNYSSYCQQLLVLLSAITRLMPFQ